RLSPRVDVAWKILADKDEILSPGNRRIADDRGDAVRNGRDERDTAAVPAVVESREQAPRLVALGKEIRRRDAGGVRFARDRRNGGLLRDKRQRSHVRAVE